MKSMTGFGHGTATGTKGMVTAEIKTVNNRFLELNIRTDHFSAAAEESIKSLIKEQVHRGKIYLISHSHQMEAEKTFMFL